MKNEVHEAEKLKRHNRLVSGVYGKIHAPVFMFGSCFYEPPSYSSARFIARHGQSGDIAAISPDLMKCFYTGVQCLASTESKIHPRLNPWVGTGDHMVPVRRHARDGMTANGNTPPDICRYYPALIWCSNVVNNMLGPVPLPVRLNIRLWMQTLNYARDDTADGENMRWIIINLLEHFRMKHTGRYFWSRKIDGTWWEPEIQNMLMESCYRTEKSFLEMNEKERNSFIISYRWHY